VLVVENHACSARFSLRSRFAEDYKGEFRVRSAMLACDGALAGFMFTLSHFKIARIGVSSGSKATVRC